MEKYELIINKRKYYPMNVYIEYKKGNLKLKDKYKVEYLIYSLEEEDTKYIYNKRGAVIKNKLYFLADVNNFDQKFPNEYYIVKLMRVQ